MKYKDMKICSKCKTEKPLTDFHKHRAGYDPRCRSCKSIYFKNHYKQNQDYFLQRRYGITLAQKREMYLAQEGNCVICQKEMLTSKDCHVDHDHITGKVRGLLCNNCNGILAYSNDNIEILLSAAKYLQLPG